MVWPIMLVSGRRLPPSPWWPPSQPLQGAVLLQRLEDDRVSQIVIAQHTTPGETRTRDPDRAAPASRSTLRPRARAVGMLTLDQIHTLAFAGIVLFLGYGVRGAVPLLGRYNI